MTRKSFFITALFSTVCLAAGAQAQTAGTYAGETADGGNISLVVTGTTGNFTITSMNVGFTADCKHPVGSTTEGWGFFLGIPVVPAGTDFHSGNHYYDITGTAKFPNNHSIKGTITSVTAVFVPGATPPDAAHFCSAPKQAFQLSLEPAAKVVPAAPGTAVALTRPDVK
jgi:hypothetical protein